MILGSPVVDGKYIFSSKNVYLFLCNDYYSVYSTTVLITPVHFNCAVSCDA